MAQTETLHDNVDMKNEFTDLAQPDFDEELLGGGDTGEEKNWLSEEENAELKDLAKNWWLRATAEKIEADKTSGWFNCKRANELNAIRWWMNAEEADTYGRVRADILSKKKVDPNDMNAYNKIKDQMQKNYESSQKW